MKDLTEIMKMGRKPDQKQIEETQASIASLDGKDIAMLNTEEEAVYSYLVSQGRKLGISVSVISEAPKGELDNATSSQEYDEIVKRYPSRISIKTS